MNAVLNPVDAEAAIRDTSNRLAQGIPVVSKAEARMTDAKRALDRAKARAYLDATGSIAEREATVELAVTDERDEYDVAYLAFKNAERTMQTLRAQLSAAQSVHKSVVQMYGAERG